MTRIYRNLADFPTLENHLRSINEILTSYQENQSIPRVKIFSHEIEGLLPSSAFYNNKFQELVFNGSLQIDGDGSVNHRSFYPNIEGVNYSNTPLCENAFSLSHGSSCEINKNNLDRNNSILTDFDNIVGEFVICKKAKKEGLKIIDLLYSLGLKTDKKGSNGGHIHTSKTAKIGLLKCNTPSFVNAVYDFHDLFTFKHNIKAKKGYLNRVNGFGNRGHVNYCNRGNNLKAQLEKYHSMAIGETSFENYPNERYYGINATMEKTPSHSNKKFNTIENRIAPVFRNGYLQREYVSDYITFVNKFLEFFKDVSVQDLTNNLLYKRVNQDKYLVGETLQNARCLTMDQYCNSYYGRSSQYVNFNIQPSLSTNETLKQNREQFLQ